MTQLGERVQEHVRGRRGSLTRFYQHGVTNALSQLRRLTEKQVLRRSSVLSGSSAGGCRTVSMLALAAGVHARKRQQSQTGPQSLADLQGPLPDSNQPVTGMLADYQARCPV